jgi:hypothetical protein
MGKLILTLLLFFCAFTTHAQYILNGSFEQNTETLCANGLLQNDYNNTVAFSSSFGSNISIIRDSCITCPSLPNFYWGGGAQDGHWFLSIQSDPLIPANISKFSLELSGPLNNEDYYKLSFYIKMSVTPIDSICEGLKNNHVEVGVSNNALSFGTLLYTSPLGDTNWTQYSVIFQTQNAEEHITVKAKNPEPNNLIVFVDNFELSTVTGIDEVGYNNRQLLKIVDILGKESSPNKKGLLFYIYSDGTVEKKLIIE